MSDLNELYQELIIDHGRFPRNFKTLPSANYVKEGFNPLCGDRLTLYLHIEDDQIMDATFEGVGCAISMASASLMTQVLKGKTFEEAQALFDAFHHLVMGEDVADEKALLGKLTVLQGVCEFPARVKCATLSWHTAIAAIAKDPAQVSTE